MYTQKISYQLVKDGYKLVEKKYLIGNVHKDTDCVLISVAHRWTSHKLYKKPKTFTNKLGWIEVPSEYIEIERKQFLSSNYFQTDDMYYYVDTRVINKKYQNKVIELAKAKFPL